MATNSLSGLAALAPAIPPKDAYRDVVTHALAGFQLLEAGLKAYIDTYYKTVRKILAGRLHFDFQRQDFDEAPLGKLAGIFCKINANQDLAKRIQLLKKHRDKAAHRAFAHLYGSHTTDAEFDRMSNEYSDLATQVAGILGELQQEHLKLVPIFEQGPALQSSGQP